ncbi:hypothetical protein G8A07_09115 [Roseateles sp. DAIF2]|uniref:hypothetical protein n=1 Tax=Roseateles sp. DAIF2 TaxID=2714952 RepID=UPI0018A2AFFD|nr:hypothetical protein [Roseateles sp. DAIF2]QPF73059.1 hypothetical protein G8A07_09115 [Roseateles sp. DAIF2]
MNLTLIQAAAALICAAATPLLAQAAPQKIEQLPRVVITGKATQQMAVVQQLPRVVIEGRSIAATTRLAQNAAAAIKPATRSL